jgi:hypothetical protein
MGCRIPASQILLAAVLVSSTAWAAQKPYGTGQVVRVEEKTRPRVLLYLVNTPIEREDPYVEVRVSYQGTTYVGEYLPRSVNDRLPSGLVPGAQIQVRLEKHLMFLKRADGSELKFEITQRLHQTESGQDH